MGIGIGVEENAEITGVGNGPAAGAVLAEGVRAGAFSAENTATVVPMGWELTKGASRIKDPNPTI